MEENLTGNNKEDVIVSQILRALRDIQFGHVQITIQDSKVVQIDKTEKVRLDGQRSSKRKGGDND